MLTRSVGVNGPGERAVIWVQGCPLRCRGCFNTEFLEFGGHHAHVRTLTVADLCERVLQEHRRQPLDGVTFSGGEPFTQAEELSQVAAVLHEHGLNVVVFSGFPHAALLSMGESAQHLLAQTDLLVAGPYVEARHLELPHLRGSSNQALVYLTDRIRPEEPMSVHAELTIDDEGCVSLTGFPSRRLLEMTGQLVRPERLPLPDPLTIPQPT